MAILRIEKLNITTAAIVVCVWLVCGFSVSCSLWGDEAPNFGAADSTKDYNVAIMAGSGTSTRTQIDPSDMKSVMWSKDDKIALWAMAESTSSFSYEAFPLSLHYFGTDYSTAIFTGNVPQMGDDTYTYFATYPLPEATDGSVVTLSLPATQSGYYDGDADLMFARIEGQEALSDNALKNGSLAFKQLTHAVRIEIPKDRDMLGATTRLQVIFPESVVGDVALDITAENPTISLSNASNSVYVDFDQVISDAGYIWIFIAPTVMDGAIEFIGYDKDNIPSQTITTMVSNRDMAAGRVTPIKLTVLEETDRTIMLSVAKNNLGEDITSMTLTAPEGAYFTGDKSSIVVTPDANKRFKFSYRASLYESIFKAKGVAVTYESKSAIVVGKPIMITDEQKLSENHIGCTVPYLFEENFSKISSNSGDADGSVTVAGYTIWSIGSHYEYWKNTSVAIKTYNKSWNTGFTNSSLKLSSISTIKPNTSVSLNISFNAGWSSNKCGGMKLKVGDSTITLDDNSGVAYNKIPDTYSATASKIGNATAVTWTTSGQNGAFFSSSHESVYIDNIKISIK